MLQACCFITPAPTGHCRIVGPIWLLLDQTTNKLADIHVFETNMESHYKALINIHRCLIELKFL